MLEERATSERVVGTEGLESWTYEARNDTRTKPEGTGYPGRYLLWLRVILGLSAAAEFALINTTYFGRIIWPDVSAWKILDSSIALHLMGLYVFPGLALVSGGVMAIRLLAQAGGARTRRREGAGGRWWVRWSARSALGLVGISAVITQIGLTWGEYTTPFNANGVPISYLSVLSIKQEAFFYALLITLSGGALVGVLEGRTTQVLGLFAVCLPVLMAQLIFAVAGEPDEDFIAVYGHALGNSLAVEVLLIAFGALLWAADHRTRSSISNLGAAIIGGAVISLVVFTFQEAEKETREEFSLAEQINVLRAQVRTTSDLSGADLGEINLDGISLRRKKLTDANFAGTSLMTADLAGADLSRAILYRADFTNAKMPRVQLTGATYGCTSFSGALVKDADLAGLTLFGDRTRELTDRRLCDEMAPGVVLDFTDADLSGAQFDGADLRFSDFSGATLDGADLRRANLFEDARLALDRRWYSRFADAEFDSRTRWPQGFRVDLIPK